MAKQTLNTLKNWFKTGLKPTQQQFWDTWDSFWHKDQIIPSAAIENLDARFDEKADQELLSAHLSDTNAHGIGNKVDKEAGKGLSSNDYTTAEKQKLAGLEPGMSILEYDPTISYEMFDIVYLEDEENNRLLYQSLMDQNLDGMAGIKNPITVGAVKPSESIYLGVMLPAAMISAVYDSNLEATISIFGGSVEGIRVKLKQDDGRKVGFYWDLLGFVNGSSPVPPLGTYKTITIKESNEQLNSTEVLIDVTEVGTLVKFIYYRSSDGLDYKISAGSSTDDFIADLSTASPAAWKYIGLPKPVPVDTTAFLNTSANLQIKKGSLNIQDELFNKNQRTLYSGEFPYNQGYGTKAYLNEYAFSIEMSVAQQGDYYILGDHYGISYFSSSFELSINDLDSTLNKTFRVKSSPGTSIGGQGIDNGLWNKILPVEDVQGSDLSTHTGSEVDLEIQYSYPGRYRLRLRTRKPRTDNYTGIRVNCIMKCDNSTFVPNPVEYNGTEVLPIVRTGTDLDFNIPLYTITERNFGAVVSRGKQTIMSDSLDEQTDYLGFPVKQTQGFRINLGNSQHQAFNFGTIAGAGLNGQRSFRVMIAEGMASGSSSKEFIIHWNYDNIIDQNGQGWFVIPPAFESGDRGGAYVLEYEGRLGQLRIRLKDQYMAYESEYRLSFFIMVETYLGSTFTQAMSLVSDTSDYKIYRGFNKAHFNDDLPFEEDFPDFNSDIIIDPALATDANGLFNISFYSGMDINLDLPATSVISGPTYQEGLPESIDNYPLQITYHGTNPIDVMINLIRYRLEPDSHSIATLKVKDVRGKTITLTNP